MRLQSRAKGRIDGKLTLEWCVSLLRERIGSDDWLAYITKRQGFLSECEGFFIEQCSWSPNEDFLRILHQETGVCACSAKIKVPEFVQKQ
jgi:hypothetical protein